MREVCALSGQEIEENRLATTTPDHGQTARREPPERVRRRLWNSDERERARRVNIRRITLLNKTREPSPSPARIADTSHTNKRNQTTSFVRSPVARTDATIAISFVGRGEIIYRNHSVKTCREKQRGVQSEETATADQSPRLTGRECQLSQRLLRIAIVDVGGQRGTQTIGPAVEYSETCDVDVRVDIEIHTKRLGLPSWQELVSHRSGRNNISDGVSKKVWPFKGKKCDSGHKDYGSHLMARWLQSNAVL